MPKGSYPFVKNFEISRACLMIYKKCCETRKTEKNERNMKIKNGKKRGKKTKKKQIQCIELK